MGGAQSYIWAGSNGLGFNSPFEQVLDLCRRFVFLVMLSVFLHESSEGALFACRVVHASECALFWCHMRVVNALDFCQTCASVWLLLLLIFACRN